MSEPLVAEPAEAVARVPEAAIQDAWVRGLFDPRRLRTTCGEAVRVVERGRLNRDSGPDVGGARLEIGGLLWAGDVEIHPTSAAWESHGHHLDPAYDRVVLHVVLAADRATGTLRRADGSALPELVLLPHLHQSLRALLRAFYVTPREAPQCAPRWHEVDEALRRDWVRRLGAERLRERARDLGRAYGHRPDLERLLVGRMFRALGYEANADPMEALAGRVSFAALRLLDGEAIRQALVASSGLGRSTLFERTVPVSPLPLRAEAWKRGGRPANAPLRRIAQAAAWLAPGGPLHQDPIPTLADALAGGVREAIERLRPTPASGPRLGADRAQRVLVDAVLPVLLLDAEQREDPALDALVADAFGQLPGAEDRVTRRFAEAGLRPASAAEAQGVHQLARRYCDEGRCARCAVGLALYPGLAEEASGTAGAE